MLRTLALCAVLAIGVCAPRDPRLYAADLAEQPFDYFEPIPAGVHACPFGTQPVGWAQGEYVELLCVRFNEQRRPQRHGPLVRHDRFGRKTLEGAYAAGLRSGTWRVYREDGSLSHELEYQRGVIQNLACAEGRFLSGTRGSGFFWCGLYLRAIRDGPEYQFRPATLRFQSLGNFRDGQRHGTWVWWDDSGQMSKVEQWVLGSLYWQWFRACEHVSGPGQR